MGVYEGRGQLSKSLKELLSRWMDAKSQWDDPVSRAFEKDVLMPIEADLRSAFSAMDHMGIVLSQIRRDCE